MMDASHFESLRTRTIAGLTRASDWLADGGSRLMRQLQRGSSESSPITRVDAHLSAAPSLRRLAPAKSTALRRDVQQVFENHETAIDLDALDQVLRDIRDLTGADEAIFWRWMETRQTLVPNAWSTEGSARPAHFNVRGWGPLVKWTAEQSVIQLAGDIGGMPEFGAAPVVTQDSVFGVLTVSAVAGLHLDRDASRSWLPRFAGQIASLIQLFDLRRAYGRQMRQSEALLDAVQRLHGHRTAEQLASALCETARDVTSAPVAGLVRWNASEGLGVVRAISPSADIEPGFHVTADSLVGRACTERLPIVLENAESAVEENCPFGGQPRVVGSLAIVPISTVDHVIGALVVEGQRPGDVTQHEARNIGLLAAVARGPLENGWEIEEVSRRARTDSLTGLANRRHFDEQLARVVAETDRFGGTCSMVLVDLDHFKSVNDQYGHEVGDRVLKHVSRLLVDGVRTVDVCARYGGEELAILLPQTSQQGALELAERLRLMLAAQPVPVGDQRVLVTGSFGVATYPSPVPYGDWLLLAADKALYEAKEAGRNCIKAIHPSRVTPALYKTSMRGDLGVDGVESKPA